MRRLSSLAALLASTLLSLACSSAPPPAAPPTAEEAPPAATARPSDAPPTEPPGDAPPETSSGSEQDWLRAGAATDGATLTSAEVVEGPAAKGATLVLGFDGSGKPPATRARLENPRLAVLVVEGVRGVKAQLPIVTGEGFRVIGKPRVIGRGPIASIGRGFYGDDSGVRIDVEIAENSGLELVEGAKGRTIELRVRPLP